ncbi:MAG: helix-turn-helix domain-containing protein [Rhodocyclaceae bacterium]|nr:helix-turn-helix domain-containing protein [Rhodocyclaceae bacterium]MBR4877372.1 helix-turn-helix domain-containing protein [Rhodocyclaceae bacterium]
MYSNIFLTNVMAALIAQRMSKKELSEKSGISHSFLSAMTTGKANPSLRVMEAVAQALEIPLPVLLEPNDMAVYTGHKLPDGFERVSLVLTKSQAATARAWAEDVRQQMLGVR